MILIITILWSLIGTLVLIQQFEDLAVLDNFGLWKQIFTTVYILAFGPLFAAAGILEEFLNIVIGGSEGSGNDKGGFV